MGGCFSVFLEGIKEVTLAVSYIPSPLLYLLHRITRVLSCHAQTKFIAAVLKSREKPLIEEENSLADNVVYHSLTF